MKHTYARENSYALVESFWKLEIVRAHLGQSPENRGKNGEEQYVDEGMPWLRIQKKNKIDLRKLLSNLGVFSKPFLGV